MASLSPNIEIINYFDNLINRIDIDIEKSIEKYKEDQVLGMLRWYRFYKRRHIIDKSGLDLEYFEPNEASKTNKFESVIEWSEKTKVIDYLNQVRKKTIDELVKGQEDSLEYLKSKSADLNQLKQSKDAEEMKSRLFADKFFFQVFCKPKFIETWVFNLFTIVVDFYLSPTDIKFFGYLINDEKYEISMQYSDTRFFIHEPNSRRIFDEKFFLLHVMTQEFCKILKTQQFPSHLISFRKQDLLNIKSIRNSTYGNSKGTQFDYSSSLLDKLESLDLLNCYLDRSKMEIFSSLESLSLRLLSIDKFHLFGHMNSLRILDLGFLRSIISNSFLTNLVEMCPNIEELSLHGKFSEISFESFVNLKKLSLCGYLSDYLKFITKCAMCNKLEDLSIELRNINDENFSKFLYGQNLPNLSKLSIFSSKITRLEKKLFDGFPMLQSLRVVNNDELKTIDKDAFSNLKNLKEFELSLNKLSEFDPELFIGLVNLEKLKMFTNKFDLKIKDYIVNIKEIHLGRRIENKKEIRNHFKKSKIFFS